MSWPVCYTHRTDARTLSLSLCLCLCRSFVISWFPNSTFLICLFEPGRAAALRRSAKSTPSRSSNQSWSPNSGQVAEDGPRNPAMVLASEHEQQPPASSFTLPQQQDDQTGLQTQSAISLLDQTQGAQVQNQPSGNDQASLAMGVHV